MIRLVWSAVWATFAVGCVNYAGPPPAAGPQNLAQAARAAQTGARRASIELVRDAESRMRAFDLRSARALTDRALRVDGRNPYAYFLSARLAYLYADEAGARRDLVQAASLLRAQEPDNTRWQGKILRARAELVSGPESAALRAEAERLDPGGHNPGEVPSHLIEGGP